MTFRFYFAVLFLLLTSAVTAQDLLFKDGKTNYKIYLPAKPDVTEINAANELKTALKKISGCVFEIVKSNQANIKNGIILGTPGTSPRIKILAKQLGLNGEANRKIAIYTIKGNLYLAGDQTRGVLYAVYEFLRKELDARWFWPNDDGEYISPKASYALAKLKFNFTSPLKYRAMLAGENPRHVPTHIWQSRNLLNFNIASRIQKDLGAYKSKAGHLVNVEKLGPNIFEKHPEYFCLMNGVRDKRGIAGCWSNPGFLKAIVKMFGKIIEDEKCDLLAIYVADNNWRCECAPCTKNPDVSSRWWIFFDKITDELKKSYPKVKFSSIAYQEYRDVPKYKIRNAEYVDYCQYNRCYVHLAKDPKCEMNKLSFGEMKKWTEKCPVGIYGYHLIAFTPMMYLPCWNMLADEIRYARDLKSPVMMTETTVRWNKNGKREDIPQLQQRLVYYIYARLLWNPDEKVQDLIADFCKKVYGPGAEMMIAYHNKMANCWETMANNHVGYIFKNPLGTAKFFLDDKSIKFIQKQFTLANTAIDKMKNGKRKIRYKRELVLEFAVYKQWEKAYMLTRGNAVTINVPLLRGADRNMKNAIELPMKSKKGKSKPTKAYIYWTPKTLNIKVVSFDDDIANLNKGKMVHDNVNMLIGDALEIFISPNDGTAYRHFGVNPAGGTYDGVSVGKGSWNSNWTVKTRIFKDRWEADIEIPFSGLGNTPKKGDQWTMVINRNLKPNPVGFPIPAYHDIAAGGILHFFDGAIDKSQRISWILPDWSNINWMRKELLESGWNVDFIKASDALNSNLKDQKLIVITIRDLKKGEAEISQDFYKKQIIPALENGAVVIFSYYRWRLPLRLEKFFGDPSFKVGGGDWGVDKGRRSTYVTNGGFINSADNLKGKILKTPCMTFTPSNPEKWEIIAKQKLKGKDVPFLLCRPYGKGLVVASGELGSFYNPSLVASIFKNFIAYNKTIKR